MGGMSERDDLKLEADLGELETTDVESLSTIEAFRWACLVCILAQLKASRTLDAVTHTSAPQHEPTLS